MLRTKFFCTVESSEEIENLDFVLDRIRWGRVSDGEENSESLFRVSSSINSLGESDDTAHNF